MPSNSRSNGRARGRSAIIQHTVTIVAAAAAGGTGPAHIPNLIKDVAKALREAASADGSPDEEDDLGE